MPIQTDIDIHRTDGREVSAKLVHERSALVPAKPKFARRSSPGEWTEALPTSHAVFQNKKSSCWHCNELWALFIESVDEWIRHKDARLGASMACYALLSLAPLLLVAFSIGGLVYSETATATHIIKEVEQFVGPQSAAGVAAMFAGLQSTRHGLIATAFGSLALLFGASSAFLELRDALNTIWEVPPRQTVGLQGIAQFAKDRLFSFALIVAVGLLLLASLLVNTWIAAAGAFFAHLLPAPEYVIDIANLFISFFVTTGLFAVTYKVMPETPIQWRDVLFGSAVTSLLFTVGKLLIGLYLGKESFVSTYGAAASVVALILWLYYSAQIFFFGAEITRTFAARYGSQPRLSQRVAERMQ